MEEITKPLLSENKNTVPYNVDYKDFYSSKLDGLAETRHVFQQGNALTFRWKNRSAFTIAETGFGTGLNFLATWQAWQNTAERGTQLHYISIEKHPLSAQVLSKLLAAWPELGAYARELLAFYPPALTGMHRLNLAGGSVRLTLCFMDVATALDELCAAVDCWYLDGFAPAKNPQMWSQAVMHKLAQCSRPDATLATYTAASLVRRHLQTAGWQVEKRPGFGKKREMLTATLAPAAKRNTPYQPWYTPPGTPNSHSLTPHHSATIIGGGIAGCQIAYALAQRGWHVTLIERHSAIAQEASGNPAGIISPKMTAQPGWGERFYRQAFLYTLQQLAQLTAAGHAICWDACGSLQLNHNVREQQRWQALQERDLPTAFIQFPDATEASALAGLPLTMGGSFFPQAGWIQPQSFCRALVQHPNITLLLETTALSLDYRQGQHDVRNSTGHTIATSDTLVISNGRDVNRLLADGYLPLTAVSGQTSTATAGPQSHRLRIALGHEGYLTPAINNRHVFGATFERDVHEPVLSARADHHNQQQLQQHLPTLSADIHDVSSGHAAIRMTTPDRYPYCGPLPDATFYQHHYAAIRHGKQHQHYPAALYRPGLFINSGFGSRGLTTSALAAELLASLINGEPLPLEKQLYYQLHPARFLLKQMKQNRA